MTTWRELCRELIDSRGPDYYRALERARKALADGSAVPEGREPASVAGEPSDQELYDYWISTSPELGCADPVGFARAVLARWGTPNLVEIRSSLGEPAEGEVAELVAALRHEAIDCTCTTLTSDDLRRAADLLERQAAPVPVAVSERLPGDALCWWYEPDEDDDLSGYGGCWTLLRIRGAVSFYTHWLPAHALPLPSVKVQP